MNVKNSKTVGLVAILIAIILAIGLFSLSCVSGLTAIGWSGGTVADGVLYVGSNEGRLVAINLADESRQQSELLKGVTQSGLFGCSAGLGCGTGTSRVPIYGTPVVSGDLVYIAGYNGKIYAYKTENLNVQRWVYPREGNLNPFVGGIAIAQDKLFIGCADGVVLALDAQTGDKLAEYKAGDKIWGTPAADGDTLYIGSFDKNLYALNIADLSLKWKHTTEGSIIATPLVRDGIVYFGSFDRSLYAVNAADGSLKWKFTGQNWFWAQPVVVDDTVYAGCMDGFVYALKADTGAKITDFDLGSPLASQPVVVDNYVVFASSKGIIFKIDSSSREITQIAAFKDATINGPLTAYQGIVYIHLQAGVLERINVSTGASLNGIPLQS